MRQVCFWAVCLLGWLPARAQELRTIPELTDYEATSRYEDVVAFLQAVTRGSDFLHLRWLDSTVEGRRLPLVIAARGLDPDPQAIARSGRLVVYIQGTIHAGEVEGKEAILELVRALRDGKHAHWLNRLVLLWLPILNADGNERISPNNRPFQHGPVRGMGQRPNARGLDLNRDHMKLESPEIRAFVSLLRRYDPAVTLDLHTTNGSFHGYHLTYSGPLNPNTDPELMRWMRQAFFPQIQHRMAQAGFRTYYYGNFERRDGQEVWATFSHEPRFNNNYVGLRNRIPILSEAYAYIPFRDRIAVTAAFVRAVLDYLTEQADRVQQLIQQAEQHAIALGRSGRDSLGVRFALVRSSERTTILKGAVRTEENPYSGRPMYRLVEDSVRAVEMPEYQAFQATIRERLPRAYYLPPEVASVVLPLLEAHGAQLERLERPLRLRGERFRILENRQDDRPFQGHRQRRLEGRWEPAELELPAGSWTLPMDQPLARLLFYLLEPRSDDGLLNWNVLDAFLEGAEYYPIWRSLP
jgi:hypothetical protein